MCRCEQWAKITGSEVVSYFLENSLLVLLCEMFITVMTTYHDSDWPISVTSYHISFLIQGQQKYMYSVALCESLAGTYMYLWQPTMNNKLIIELYHFEEQGSCNEEEPALCSDPEDSTCTVYMYFVQWMNQFSLCCPLE